MQICYWDCFTFRKAGGEQKVEKVLKKKHAKPPEGTHAGHIASRVGLSLRVADLVVGQNLAGMLYVVLGTIMEKFY